MLWTLYSRNFSNLAHIQDFLNFNQDACCSELAICNIMHHMYYMYMHLFWKLERKRNMDCFGFTVSKLTIFYTNQLISYRSKKLTLI